MIVFSYKMISFEEGIALYVANGSDTIIGSVVDAEYGLMPDQAKLPQIPTEDFLEEIGAKNNWRVAVDIIGKHSFLIRVFKQDPESSDESNYKPFSCSKETISKFISSVIDVNK